MDRLQTTCTECKKGVYVETCLQDDWYGTLHCNICKHQVNRHSDDDNKIRIISCVYDNPTTENREWWIDGMLLTSMPMEIIEDLQHSFPYDYIRPWNRGNMLGDKSARKMM